MINFLKQSSYQFVQTEFQIKRKFSISEFQLSMKLSCRADRGDKNFEPSSICKIKIASGWSLIVHFQIL